MRGGAVAARRAHNPKVPGSSPGPATNFMSPIMQNLRFGCTIHELSITIQNYLYRSNFHAYRRGQ